MRSARLTTPVSLPSASVIDDARLALHRHQILRVRDVRRLQTGDRWRRHDQRCRGRLGRDALGERARGQVTVGHDAHDPLARVADRQETDSRFRHHCGGLQDGVLLRQPLQILVHDVCTFHGRILLNARISTGRASFPAPRRAALLAATARCVRADFAAPSTAASKDCGIANAGTPRIHGPSPGTRLESADARRTPMLRIKNIMSKSVYVVDAEASAEEAAWGLTRRHIGGAPARDAEGNLIGVLSSSDLVNPEPAQWIRGEATVGDLMNPDVISLYADDPAMAAVNEMAKRDIHRIVVLDAEGKLAGIVTPMDVVRALADGRSFDLAD